MDTTEGRLRSILDPRQSREGKLLDALIVVCTTALAWVKVFDASIAAMILLSLVSGRNVVGGISKAFPYLGGGSDRPPPSGGGGTGSQDQLRAVQPPPTPPREPGTFVKRSVTRAFDTSVIVNEGRNAIAFVLERLGGARPAGAGLAVLVAVLLGCVR